MTFRNLFHDITCRLCYDHIYDIVGVYHVITPSEVFSEVHKFKNKYKLREMSTGQLSLEQ